MNAVTVGTLKDRVRIRWSWRGDPNPISQEIVFFKSQLKSHNPSLCCSNWNPIPIFLLFFHESQSQYKKSHFPASKKGKSQFPFYPFTTLVEWWRQRAWLVEWRQCANTGDRGERHTINKHQNYSYWFSYQDFFIPEKAFRSRLLAHQDGAYLLHKH